MYIKNHRYLKMILATTLFISNTVTVSADNFVISDNPVEFQTNLNEDEYLTGSDITDILTRKTYNGAPGLNDLISRPEPNIDEGELVPDQPEEDNPPTGSGGRVPSTGTRKKYTDVNYDSQGIPDSLVDTGKPVTQSGSGALQGIQWPFDMNRLQGQTIKLSSWFAYRKDSSLEFHNGLDLSGCTGENGVAGQLNLYAPADCKIAIINRNSSPYTGFGNTVVMEFKLTDSGSSPTYRFMYGHMSYINAQLQQGMSVKQGEFIGRVGNTGGDYATHLHFSILVSSDGTFPSGVPKKDTSCGSTDYLVNPLIVYGLPATARGNDSKINQWGSANKISMPRATYDWESKSEPKNRNKSRCGTDNVSENCFKQIILPSYLLN